MRAKGLFAWRYLAPTAFLAVFGLDVMVVALPSLGLILVTREFHMYAGIGHYTAEIVPFALLAALIGIRRISHILTAMPGRGRRAVVAACCAVLLLGTLASQAGWGYLPVRAAMGPPPLTAHAREAQSMLELIPADAAVSAEEGLAPHLGERAEIYLFPDLGPHKQAQYVALDVAGDSFPLQPINVYDDAQSMLASGQWGVRFAGDGLLLLQRGARQTRIPPAFLDFLDITATGQPREPALARFGSTLELIDYRLVYRPLRYLGYPVLELATRWRVVGPVPADLHLVNAIAASRGVGGAWTDFAATDWYPPAQWRAGQTFWVQMQTTVLPLGQTGTVAVNVAVYQGSPAERQIRGLRLSVRVPPSAKYKVGVGEGGTLLHLASVEAES